MNLAPPPKKHVLTVALEDYFQVGAFNQFIQNRQWYRFEARLEQNTERTLALLDRYQIKATFFVLGWVGEHFPQLVRRVAERGHEIASKGYYHRSIRQMTPDEFRDDLRRAQTVLEQASGTQVRGFRVAHEWLRPADLWALDVLADEGYAYDSSIAPLFRRFALEPWRRFLHYHDRGERRLWELPLSSTHFLGMDIPIAGGNYFRQFPHWLVRRGVERWHRQQDAPFVMYFHVWELDPEQPKLSAPSRLARIRHYRNLSRMEEILEFYFARYSFGSAANVLGLERPAARPFGPPATRIVPVPDGEPTLAEPRDKTLGTAAKTPVTVLVPCYNEELVLPYLANTLKSVRKELGGPYDLHFLFVDDGSADHTWTELDRNFGDWPQTQLVRHGHNQGVAAAIMTGLGKAPTDIVCSIDCDCTYDPHELQRMIPYLKDGVDLVTASPYHPQGEVRNVPGWRLFLSRMASRLYRRILRQKLHTYTSCFRVYRKTALTGLTVRRKGYLGIAEILGRLDLQGATIVEFPTRLEVRMLGRSKMKTLWTILGHIRLMTALGAMRLKRALLPSQKPAGAPSSAKVKSSAAALVAMMQHEQLALLQLLNEYGFFI